MPIQSSPADFHRRLLELLWIHVGVTEHYEKIKSNKAMTIISLCFKPSWQTDTSKPDIYFFMLYFPALALGGCISKN